MSNPDQDGDNSGKALIDYGVALAHLGIAGSKITEQSERLEIALKTAKQLNVDLPPESAVPILNATTRLITEYTKRATAYASVVQSVVEEFERERDEIKEQYQL